MESRPACPKVLNFFRSAQHTYRRPLISPDEIFCSPDTETRIENGRLLSLKTPAGSFDAGALRGLIPDSQLPDLVVVNADATLRNLPRNLGAFKCPRVLLVGDTHHLNSPLRSMIGYAQAEPFDRIVFNHTRHHAHWFAKAGLGNLHWIPALDYGFAPRDIRAKRSRPLTFVGNVGRLHPWRRSVLSTLRRVGLPLEVLQGTLAETADCYADSDVTLNISLNGDLNLRVFEALAAGGFLITDDLPEASGLRALFEPGRHLEVWRSTGELIAKIRHYLENPAEAERIRRDGRAEILRSHTPATKIRELYELVFDGRANPRYDLGLGAPARPFLAPPRAEPGRIPHLAAYEWIQEIHRTSQATALYCGAALPALLGVADLPRLTLLAHEELRLSAPPAHSAQGSGPSEVLWLDDAGPAFLGLITRFTGAHVIAPGAAAARLAEWGFHPAARSDDGLCLFRLAHRGAYLRKARSAGQRDAVKAVLPSVLAAPESAEDCLLAAQCARETGDKGACVSALQRAVALDRSCQPALVQLGAVALERADYAFAAMALDEARRCGPLPASADRIRIQLEEGQEEKLRPYLALAGRAGVERAETTRRILVVTNLFPPQELGGYGRMMWEFARGLRARGHAVRVLTSDAGYLGKAPRADEAEMESRVSRTLRLTGRWGDGGIHQSDRAVRAGIEASNAQVVREEAAAFEPDLILLGNLDLLGVRLVHEAILDGHPVLHAVANKEPGYSPAEQPRSPRYWIAPCSEWNGAVLREAGYAPARIATVYPGARLDNFYRAFPADSRTLRIAYASIVAPYKGTHVLVDALARLHALGVPFTAEIAGEALDTAFAGRLREFCARSGMASKVSFPGFLDRGALAALFARSNVLSFPSQFPEPFGISQVEAMASGLVVVTSGTGGAAEVVRDGEDGLVHRAEDAAALAVRLRSLASDPALFQRLQAAGQRRALSFSVDASVRRIEDLAEEMIRSAAAPAGARAPAARPAPEQAFAMVPAVAAMT